LKAELVQAKYDAKNCNTGSDNRGDINQKRKGAAKLIVPNT
jgi:hypothetical protein